MSKSLPFIGWKACDDSFYLDGCPITVDEAFEHWTNSTAIFLPHAARELRLIAHIITIAKSLEDGDVSLS
jgi:hypothetical protein